MQVNPKGKEKGKFRMDCGGGWNSQSQNCRAAIRGNCCSSTFSHFDLGFRVALTPVVRKNEV